MRTFKEVETPMKMEMSVAEVLALFKEIQGQPGKVFEMIRLDVREMVGKYRTEVMNAELTHFLGREPYEGEERNYRNGFYGRKFTIKGIGDISIKVPGIEMVNMRHGFFSAANR